MSSIYEPKGAAREYSPLAINYIRGCDHGCKYCYVPIMMKKFDSSYVHSNVYIKEETKLLNEIVKSASKYKGSKKQVFMSFTTDPYTTLNEQTKLTSKVLKILLSNKIPVSILSKGGKLLLQDIDLFKQFKQNIQIGQSLTFTNEQDSIKWEPNAALPKNRFEVLKILKDQDIKTWASMEPVIYPDQSLEIMEKTVDYIDSYKIGKLNHFAKHEEKFDWSKFLFDSVSIMRKHNKKFYIKKDLLKYKPKDLFLSPDETNMDYLSLENDYNW